MKRLFNRSVKEVYNHLEVVERPNSFTSESLQKLIINLEYANVDKKYQAIQVTSTLSGEGKTTLIGNMSLLLAQRGHKVILIDLDLRKPKVNRLFDFPNDIGIANYLHGSVTLEKAIKKTEHNVDVLVAGERISAVATILQSKKLAELVEELKKQYDYVLIDTPPVQVNSDSIMISKLIDGIVYVVGYNFVKKNMVRDALRELTKLQIPIIGTVLAQVKLPKSGNYYYYYGDS